MMRNLKSLFKASLIAASVSVATASAADTDVAIAPMPLSTMAMKENSQLHVDALCHKIAKKLRSVYLSDCLNNGFSDSGGSSVQGAPILVKEYPPVEGNKPLSKVLLIGGIHGDEFSSISIVFKWINKLDKFHSGMFHWRVVPLMNPDGLLQKKSQRMNSRGVDLNRNFPTPEWEAKSHHYWVQKTRKNPRRYPGPSALSEPESRWLADYIEEFQPDVIVSVHAPYGILDFDGPNKPPKKLGHLHLNVLGTYPGSLGNYAGVQKEIPVVTIELPYAGIMPTQAQIRNIWMDLVQWLKKDSGQREMKGLQQVKNQEKDSSS